MQSGNLKTVFAVVVILGFSVTLCYYRYYRILQSNPVIPAQLSDLPSESMEYSENLWRPFLEDIDMGNVSDRIASQLKWTKKLFTSRWIDFVPGKNILLVFGKEGKQFYDTGNKINCPGFTINPNQCKLTVSKNLEERNLSPENFDAFIYTQDYKSPTPKNLKIPKRVKQFYYTEECPYMLSHTLKENDLLVSYYRGSDIVLPYSKWVAYDSDEAQYFDIMTPNRSELSSLSEKDFANGKTGFAVVLTSNCGNVANDRFKYIKELANYVSIDMFGNCGTPPPCLANTSKYTCINSVVRKYKFYLAFENSNCRDYITEKFFYNALTNDVIPVVLGAHPDDYIFAAPPNSYINVQDFQSPKLLAEYLQTLDQNQTLYNEYFRWKGTGTFYHAWKDLFCRLCGMLFYSDFVPPHPWTKPSTWAEINACLPRKQWHWHGFNSGGKIISFLNSIFSLIFINYY